MCLHRARSSALQAFLSDLVHCCLDACSWLFAWTTVPVPIGECSWFVLEHSLPLPDTPDAPEGLVSSNPQPREGEETAWFDKLQKPWPFVLMRRPNLVKKEETSCMHTV